MFYIKPICKSFSETEVADVVGNLQTAYGASIHIFFEQVAKLNNKPAQAVVQISQSNTIETIHTIKELA